MKHITRIKADTNTAVHSSMCLATLSTGLTRNQQQITVTFVFKKFAKQGKKWTMHVKAEIFQ